MTTTRFNILATIAGVSLLAVSSAVAQKTNIEAEIKGPDGRAAKDAVVRIERQDKQAPGITQKTDARGRVAAKNLDAGTYRLTAALPNGAQSAQVVKAAAARPVLVTFKMEAPTPGQTAAVKKKIFVWVPTTTGTHMGGHYEEVGGAQTDHGPSAQNIERVSPTAILRPPVATPTSGR